MTAREDSIRLKIALGWLESHRKRRQVERDSTQRRLEELQLEIKRIGREIDSVKSRLREPPLAPEDDA